MRSPLVQQLNSPLEVMKFTLVYEGKLPGNKQGLLDIKRDIRRQIHWQLRELIQGHSALRKAQSKRGYLDAGLFGRDWEADELTSEVAAGNFKFAALISEDLARACTLDIQLLCPVPPAIFEGGSQAGDIDNRFKTLIDGLRRPKNPTELKSMDRPMKGETPFYCLLDDDSLVRGLNVRATQWYMSKANQGKDWAKAIIEVSLQITRMTTANWPFLAS